MSRYCSLLVLMLVTLAGWSLAQDGGETGTDQQARPVPNAVRLLNRGSLAFSSELEPSNHWSGGIRLGSTFDDNVLSAKSDRTSDFAYMFMPFIAIEQARMRLRWKLNYAGGFVVNQRVTAYNRGSHSLGFESQYRLSPHVTLEVRDQFLTTIGFYDQLSQNFENSSAGVLNRPNQFVVTPLAKHTTNQASSELNYQFDRDSIIGASASFNLAYFRDIPANYYLVDSQSLQGEAFYSHRIVSQNWVGVSYRYQKLTFSPLANNTFVHSILLTDSMYLTPHMSLALFAGPERVQVRSNLILPITILPSSNLFAVSVTQNNWGWTAGGSFNWTGARNSLVADGVRTINDGGGLMGSVQLTSANVAVRHRWTESLSTEFGVMYGDNRAISSFLSPYSKLQNISGNFGIRRQLGNSLELAAAYGRILQHQNQGIPGVLNINHNRAWVNLSYSFRRPLGR